MASTVLSTSHTSEHVYVNGRQVRNVDLTKTQKNQFVQVKGHINGRPIHYQNYPWPMRGMTTLKSRRKRRVKRTKTEKKSKSEKSLSKRK